MRRYHDCRGPVRRDAVGERGQQDHQGCQQVACHPRQPAASVTVPAEGSQLAKILNEPYTLVRDVIFQQTSSGFIEQVDKLSATIT